MNPPNVSISGTITIDDVESSFDCDLENGWNQWGATTERLCESQPVVEAILKALIESY